MLFPVPILERCKILNQYAATTLREIRQHTKIACKRKLYKAFHRWENHNTHSILGERLRVMEASVAISIIQYQKVPRTMVPKLGIAEHGRSITNIVA
jgi:hypothetical protein